MYQVSSIPAFNDNYIWLLTGQENLAAVVDPGDGEAVLTALEEKKLTLSEVLITHHHPDHIGGVPLLLEHFPNAKVYVPSTQRFAHLGQAVHQGEAIHINATNSRFQVIELHGHTKDHIGYIDEAKAFVGDTLFSAGCGRLFEGSAEQMYASMTKLAALDHATQLYCAHEYTLSNLDFAETVDKDNPELKAYKVKCKEKRTKGESTIPTTVGQELRINPFLRCHLDSVQLEIQRQKALDIQPDPVETFRHMRLLKDNF